MAMPFIGVGAGATRWIDLGFMNFQPSEPAKIAVIVLLARYLSQRSFDQIYKLIFYVPALLIIAITASLIFVQPDLGTGLIRDSNIRKRVLDEIKGFAKSNLENSTLLLETEAHPKGTDGNQEFFLVWKKES